MTILRGVKRTASNPRSHFLESVLLHLDPDLHQRVAASAAESGVSVNSWVREVLEEYVS